MIQRNNETLLSKENLMDKILSNFNLHEAWKKVKANGGVPGIDGVTILEFKNHAKKSWNKIKSQLTVGKYKPKPVKRVEIPKPNGGKRKLGIPCVMDRVIQQAVLQVLDPIFDPSFSKNSFGFRKGRNAHQAIERARQNWQEGFKMAVDLDLYHFFDEVNHDILMHNVSKKIKDKMVLKLIGNFLRSGVVINGKQEKTQKGCPQGGPLSPLLSNIILDVLDKELEKRGHRFVRYADDAIIQVKSLRAGDRVMNNITHFLEKKLKLKVNTDKSKVSTMDSEVTFLGFILKRGQIRWSDKAFCKFIARIKELTNRSHRISMRFRVNKLNEYIRGWMGYFGISKYYSPIPNIDHWIRRRIRMCFWVDWKYCRNRIREMIKRKAPTHQAILTGLSRKGPWHLSKTFAMNMAINDKFLKDFGLLSVKELWIQIHYPNG